MKEANGLVPVDCFEDSLIGQDCVVVYDRMPYPGMVIIVDGGEELEVKVMCRNEPNRFFLPSVEDQPRTCVITLIDEELVTKHHLQTAPHLWSLIYKKLDLDEQGKPMK